MKPPAAFAAATFLVALGLPGTAARAGETVVLQSRAGERAALLELYTSEGCSSCPRADAWLSQLAASPRLWTGFVPVAFHVDYWNNLGWKDRFSSAAFTARQRDYGTRFGGESIYTPEFVLDGREWQRWGNSGGEVPAADRANPGALTATVGSDSRTVIVVYTPAARLGAAREVSVSLLGFGLQSSVRAGENRGRNLLHDFVALGLEKKTLSAASSGRQEATFRLPEAPKDAGRLAVAVWVAEAGGAGAEQVVGGWLNGSPRAAGLATTGR